MKRSHSTPRTLAGLLLALAFIPGVRAKHIPEGKLPTYNIPRMSAPPTLDGVIDPAEWREAVQFTGAAATHSCTLYVRPVQFWLGWDAEHLYIAARAGVNPGERLVKRYREKYSMGTVGDDSFEFGLGLDGRNKQAGEVNSFYKWTINPLGSTEYRKMYPEIGQYLSNWNPDIDYANRVTPDGKWWEMEFAMNVNDLELPGPMQAGELVRLLMARNFKNPAWMQAQVPVAKGYMDDTGFTVGTLTADQPYVQVEQLDGLFDDQLQFRAAIHNPGPKPVRIQARVAVGQLNWPGHNQQRVFDEPAFVESRDFEIPAGGSVRLDHDIAALGFEYRPPWPLKSGFFDLRVTLADAPDAAPVYTSYFEFMPDKEKAHLISTPGKPFDFESLYNPIRQSLWLAGDTLDALLPAGAAEPAGLRYVVKQEDKVLAEGMIEQMVHQKYQGLVQLPDLPAGTYTLQGALVDANGQALLTEERTLTKKDEAKEFAHWWDNDIGHTERLLRPFTPLKVKGGDVACVLRTYSLDALGLPRRIASNGGELLAAPARLIVTVAGKDVNVPLKGRPSFTTKKDWKVEFKGKSKAAGLRFDITGVMEQDGLVDLHLTYGPDGKPVEVERLRLEWPVDDTVPNRMICIGMGNNYSTRKIGEIPPGDGVVWSTMDLGKVGSGMTVGNFYQQVWIGTEQRGFLWHADSDQGWVPRDDMPAHELVREKVSGVRVQGSGRSATEHRTSNTEQSILILRNNLINVPAGENPFLLDAPRTVRFQYMASPFKPLEPGWRLSMRSAAGSFSVPGFKRSRDGNFDGWSMISPPSPKVEEWPGYYAEYKEKALAARLNSVYGVSARVRPFLCNQMALRGYQQKTAEPGVYDYFGPEWLTGGSETMNKSYNDYFMHLLDRWVKEGGLRSVYYDISMILALSSPWNGHGYFLDDGRIQPSGGNMNLREFYKRNYATLVENGYYPSGVSGHNTHSYVLISYPWADAVLDSEFHMVDAIDTYPSEAMIAADCPHTWGTQVDHLGFMNPHWSMMHDGGSHMSGIAEWPEFRHWGMARAEVEFVPYWRNESVVKQIAPGLLASLWKRPGSVVVALMNYGPDPADAQQARAADLTLDLRALGVPKEANGERLRIRELERSPIIDSHIYQLDWVKALPKIYGNEHEKKIGRHLHLRPEIAPTLDAATGALGGFEIGYHDQRYLVISWDAQPINDAVWKNLFDARMRPLALEWGLNDATAIPAAEVARLFATEHQDVAIQAWKKPGSVLIRIANTGKDQQQVHLTPDLAALGLAVTPQELDQHFVNAYDLQAMRDMPRPATVTEGSLLGDYNQPIHIREDVWRDQDKYGDIVFDAHQPLLTARIPAGGVRYLCVSKY